MRHALRHHQHFPGFFVGFFDYGIVRRAQAQGLVTVQVHDLRAFAHDRHRTVDDRPFGGGEGMVLKPEPLAEALESLEVSPKPTKTESAAGAPATTASATSSPMVILLSAQGRPFSQAAARELSSQERIVLICGRYEGVDERINRTLLRHGAFDRGLRIERWANWPQRWW